jgi:hypothetical protein
MIPPASLVRDSSPEVTPAVVAVVGAGRDRPMPNVGFAP